MKKILTLGLISLLSAPGALAVAVGGAELAFTGVAGVRFDDNILLSDKAEDGDVIFDFIPGVELSFGRNAQLSGMLALEHAFARYADKSALNTDLFSGDFVSRFDDGKTKLGLDASFKELNQNTADIRGLVRRDVFSVGATGELEVSPKTAVGTGLFFVHENFKRTQFTDSDSLTVPIDLYFKYTPKLDVSVGYRYRRYEVDRGLDSTDNFFNIGARGEFSPKLTGRLAVGLNNRRLERGGNENRLGVDASFDYELTPKTNLNVTASEDFGTSPSGQQQKNRLLSAFAVSRLTTQTSVNAGVRARRIDYGTHKDNYFEGQVGAEYVVNAKVRVVAAVVHRKYNSKQASSEFSNNVVSISAHLRF